MNKTTAKTDNDKPEPNPVLEAALRYLDLGFSVIPVHGVVNGGCACGRKNCSSPGKHPALPSWKKYQEQPATKAEIRRWFNRRSRHNVGIVTGKISGVVVLDVDGEEGHQALAEAGYKIPPTVHAHTGGGGDHYYFEYPEGGLGNSAGSIARKVDVRGDGGFVVAPPSIHRSGDHYTWVVAPNGEE